MASPSAHAARALGPFAALERLGGDCRFRLVCDAAAALALCSAGEELVDLVVADAALGEPIGGLLSALRASGPPVVVAGPDVPPEAALVFVRRGAADCVSLAGDASALAEVALEQLARWREQRAGEARVRELERFQSEVLQLQSQVMQTEKMASIGQLAAGVAHEINNPMGFIHANLFQMAEYASDLRRVWERVLALQKAAAAGGAPEALARAAGELAAVADEVDVGFLLSDLAQAIRESQEGSERIRHIVSDLRDFSHQGTAERVLADVNQCLDSTASIVWPMMKHLVVLEKQYADLPEVSCYPMQLKQVFMNLLVNAYQAIEERLGEGGETGTIWLDTSWREGGVAISVRDTGVGIAGEHLDRIFDPFFTTKKVGAGTGLGLSTSYSIVKRHGGWIAADSRPGEGSEFRLWLPGEAGAEVPEPGRRDGAGA